MGYVQEKAKVGKVTSLSDLGRNKRGKKTEG